MNEGWKERALNTKGVFWIAGGLARLKQSLEGFREKETNLKLETAYREKSQKVS